MSDSQRRHLISGARAGYIYFFLVFFSFFLFFPQRCGEGVSVRERGNEGGREGKRMEGDEGGGQLERGDKRRRGGFYAGEGRGEEGGRLLIDSGGVGETPRQSRERENPASAG